jgi:hypothetical protein
MADLAEKLGMPINISASYYQQFTSLKKVMTEVYKRLDLGEMSAENKQELAYAFEDVVANEAPDPDVYQRLKDTVKEHLKLKNLK